MRFLQLRCVARPGGVRVLLWVSICYRSPSSMHNNIPKGSDPASSLPPRAGAGREEFCLYQEPEGIGSSLVLCTGQIWSVQSGVAPTTLGPWSHHQLPGS